MTSKREIVELGQILQRKNVRLGDAAEPPILTCTENHGLVDQIKHMGKRLATEDASKYKVVDPGDIVYNVYLLWLGSIGQNVTGSRGITSPVYEVFTPSDSVCGPYIGLLLRSSWMVERYSAIAIGTVPRRRRTPWQDFLKLTVALPPLAEQRRIVDLIGALDDAIEAATLAANGAVQLLSTISEDLIFKESWDLSKVSQIAEPRGLIGGPFGSSLGVKDYRESGVPVIRGKNMPSSGKSIGKDFVFVSPEKAAELHRNIAIPGDVVFTQRGTLGQVGMVPPGAHPEYIVSQSQMRLRTNPHVATHEYIYFVFSTHRMVAHVKSLNSATANPHINLGILRNIEIPIPPVEAQREIVEKLEALEAMVNGYEAHTASLRALRSELLTALLSGARVIPESYDEVMNAG